MDLQSQINELQEIVFDGIDNDGDGFSENQGDCDDNNALIYPNATEECDSLDNNCKLELLTKMLRKLQD